MATSFAADVRPILFQFKAQMMWRFDLTNYEQVKACAQIIYDRISDPNNPMPPPPFPPLTATQIGAFKSWMDDGCQP